jgi:hypothetical protein
MILLLIAVDFYFPFDLLIGFNGWQLNGDGWHD